jgi:hypothetical protein
MCLGIVCILFTSRHQFVIFIHLGTDIGSSAANPTQGRDVEGSVQEGDDDVVADDNK